MLWIWVFHPSFGVLNGALRALGLIDGSIPWLISPQLALISVVRGACLDADTLRGGAYHGGAFGHQFRDARGRGYRLPQPASGVSGM